MSALPIVNGHQLDDTLAWCPAGPVTVRAFLADAQAVAKLLPKGNWVLNLCEDRYHFAVLFAACLLADKTSLQPASQSAETLRQIRRQCPNVFCLCDSAFDSLDLPRVDFPDSLAVHPHHNYYAGRADADLTPWLAYFIATVADVFSTVRSPNWGTQQNSAFAQNEKDKSPCSWLPLSSAAYTGRCTPRYRPAA